MNYKQYLKPIILFLLLFAGSNDMMAMATDCRIVSDIHQKDAFPLTESPIVFDRSDSKLVEKTVYMFASDVEAVTGKRPQTSNNMMRGDVVIIGTLGHNRWIDRLVTDRKLDVSRIQGGWEQFVIQRVNHPMRGVDRALVIAGSDRRGTAYAAFTISQQMGVSPWTWWADVPVVKHPRWYVTADYTSATPSVKYRGIFINDEDWGMNQAARKGYQRASK